VQIRIRAIITARVFGAQQCSFVFISQEVQQTLPGVAALREYAVAIPIASIHAGSLPSLCSGPFILSKLLL
jgi:hypothetical protein